MSFLPAFAAFLLLVSPHAVHAQALPAVHIIATGGTISSTGDYWRGRPTRIAIDSFSRIRGLDTGASISTEQALSRCSLGDRCSCPTSLLKGLTAGGGRCLGSRRGVETADLLQHNAIVNVPDRRIRELIEAIVAGAPAAEAEFVRQLLLNHNDPYTVIGTDNPALDPLVNELIEPRNQQR